MMSLLIHENMVICNDLFAALQPVGMQTILSLSIPFTKELL